MQVVHCDTPAGRLGLMTCYDLRFPWLSDMLRGQGGAEILSYPSAFTVKTGVFVDMWQVASPHGKSNFPRMTSVQSSMTELVQLAVEQARHTGMSCCGHEQLRRRFVIAILHVRSAVCWRHMLRQCNLFSVPCSAMSLRQHRQGSTTGTARAFALAAQLLFSKAHS